MTWNAGGQKRYEPLHLEAVRNRLEYMRFSLYEKPFSSEDFEQICNLEGILITRQPRKWEGAYFRFDGQDIIYIRSSLSGAFKTFVEFHELAHYWLHQPELTSMHFFNRARFRIDKAEHQASTVSACMLIPTTYVESFSTDELLDLFGYREIVEMRLQIYQEFHL